MGPAAKSPNSSSLSNGKSARYVLAFDRVAKEVCAKRGWQAVRVRKERNIRAAQNANGPLVVIDVE